MAGANSLLVRWEGGWLERRYPGVVDHVREAMLSVGALKSIPEAERVADGQLAHFAFLQTLVTIGMPNDGVIGPVGGGPGDAPQVYAYLDFLVGDQIESLGRYAALDFLRVVGITVTENNDDGTATVTPNCATRGANDFFVGAGPIRPIDPDAAKRQTIKKMLAGSMGGRAKVASPAQFRIGVPHI